MELKFLLAVLGDGTYRGKLPTGIDDILTESRDTVVEALQHDLNEAREHVIAANYMISRANRRIPVAAQIETMQRKLAKTVVMMSSMRSQHKREIATLQAELKKSKQEAVAARRKARGPKKKPVATTAGPTTKKKRKRKRAVPGTVPVVVPTVVASKKAK
jgi:peptidoglycan hydrolase CwlO-like protein